MHIQSDLSEQTICQLAKKHGLQMTPLSRYYRCQNTHSDKDFIVNYANVTSADIDKIINILLQIVP
ncbi:putative transcriptional regulator of pyridoxine metabolism [Streptococcus gallolyticus]|uniref:Putative transcriptional regulator of pyridoxine metabolism n=1 Tax=Streptococcus gallolyticus TaxID=315405 RepID=A0A139QT70_9STRE|nr:putative transcriptional regulator of pyridoxine metabolism [Streptococcus gallolyticus]